MNIILKLTGASVLTLTLFAGAALAQQSAPASDATAGTTATMAGGLTIDELTARVATGAEVDFGAIGADAHIMIVAISSLGGSVDGLRAAAVAGGPVQEAMHQGVSSNGVITAALQKDGYESNDVVAVYVDAMGGVWVYVDEMDEQNTTTTGAGAGGATGGGTTGGGTTGGGTTGGGTVGGGATGGGTVGGGGTTGGGTVGGGATGGGTVGGGGTTGGGTVGGGATGGGTVGGGGTTGGGTVGGGATGGGTVGGGGVTGGGTVNGGVTGGVNTGSGGATVGGSGTAGGGVTVTP